MATRILELQCISQKPCGGCLKFAVKITFLKGGSEAYNLL